MYKKQLKISNLNNIPIFLVKLIKVNLMKFKK